MLIISVLSDYYTYWFSMGKLCVFHSIRKIDNVNISQ